MLQTPTTTDREVTMLFTFEDFETEAEREEREAVQAGNDWPLLSDSALVERDDEIAEAYSEYTACGCGDRLCPCEKYPVDFATYRRNHLI